jgi:hypothetical protein
MQNYCSSYKRSHVPFQIVQLNWKRRKIKNLVTLGRHDNGSNYVGYRFNQIRFKVNLSGFKLVIIFGRVMVGTGLG